MSESLSMFNLVTDGDQSEVNFTQLTEIKEVFMPGKKDIEALKKIATAKAALEAA